MITPARYDMPTAYAGNSFGPVSVDFDEDVTSWTFVFALNAGPDEVLTVNLGNGLSLIDSTTLQIGPFETPNPSSSQARITYELRAAKPDGTDDAYLVGLAPITRDELT